MAVTYYFEEKIPKYLCLSSDVVNGKVPGISVIGSKVLFTDLGTEWIVGDDQKLFRYASNIMGGTSGSMANTTALASTDAGPSWTASHGISGSPVVLASGSVLTNVTDAPTSGQKLVITDIFLSSATAMTVTFKCETTNAPIAGPFDLPAGMPLQLTPRSNAWSLVTADKHLQILTSVSGSIMVDPHYYSRA